MGHGLWPRSGQSMSFCWDCPESNSCSCYSKARSGIAFASRHVNARSSLDPHENDARAVRKIRSFIGHSYAIVSKLSFDISSSHYHEQSVVDFFSPWGARSPCSKEWRTRMSTQRPPTVFREKLQRNEWFSRFPPAVLRHLKRICVCPSVAAVTRLQKSIAGYVPTLATLNKQLWPEHLSSNNTMLLIGGNNLANFLGKVEKNDLGTRRAESIEAQLSQNRAPKSQSVAAVRWSMLLPSWSQHQSSIAAVDR